jgi:two-component system nitrogen regulation sensor histidine kinase NtrY
MRSYAFTVISHILGIVLSTGLLFYCVHEEIIFCPTFCGIAILYFSIHLYFIQMRQVKYWRYGLLAAARLDPDRSFTL